MQIFFLSRSIIVIDLSICQIFISDLGQCKCVSDRGELIELNECFCATMSYRLFRIKLKWVG